MTKKVESYRWEELNAATFQSAVEEAEGVCLLPLGVLEYHGSHLPLGTDMIRAHRMAIDVAAREPAVVFPALYLTANVEAKIYPGTIALRDELLLPLLESVCDEISRNGMKKIIMFSGHGGNKWLLPLFVQMLLDKDKDYVVYLLNNRGIDPEAVGGYMDYEVFRDVFETQEYGHADEWETSEILYLQPELVNLESVAGDEWLPENRLAHLKNTYTPMDWFSMQPDLTRGTPGPATAEKGRRFWAHQIDRLVDIVRAIKADDVAPRLYREFNDRLKEPPGIAEGV